MGAHAPSGGSLPVNWTETGGGGVVVKDSGNTPYFSLTPATDGVFAFALLVLGTATFDAAIVDVKNDNGNTYFGLDPSANSGDGEVDLHTSAIVNVADPTNAQDAATKKYVDDAPAPTLAELLAADGDANGGTITNLADPAGDQDVDTPAARNAAIAAAIVASRVPLDYAQHSAGAFSFAEGDTLIAGNQIALDGATPISVEFYVPVVAWAADASICRYTLSLYDGATELGPIADGDFAAEDIVGNMPFYLRTPPFTPAVGNHTYAVKAKLGSGSAEGNTGVGGNAFPMYLRVNLA